MRKSLIVLVAMTSLALTSAGVLADDIVIPWWRHGKDPNPVLNKSTLQEWLFSTNDSLFVPPEPGFVNPQPAMLSASISAPAIWDTEISGRTGVWSLSEGATMAFQIPNYSGGLEKKIWIQLTWMPEQQGGEPTFGQLMTLPPYTLLEETLVTEQPLDNGWIHSTYMILVRPNPQLEVVNILGDIYVDEVVVDTICPEPATMVLLGLAVPFVLKRRRRN
jgi:hypothetical protein